MRLRFIALATVLLLLVTACGDGAPFQSPTGAPADVETNVSNCDLGASDELTLAQVGVLLERVEALHEEGALNSGQTRALHNHLVIVRQHVEAGRYCPARAQLDAFASQVEEFRGDGVLTDRQMGGLLQPLRLITPTPPLPGDVETMYAPGVVGELRTVQIDGHDLTYEVIDGLAIFQSDMILGYADEFEAMIAGGGGSIAVDGPPVMMSAVCRFNHFGCERWTDGIVGYDFAFDWFGSNIEMQRRIESAINHWRVNTGMEFARRTSGERIVFRNGSGCSSFIGRRVFTGAEPQWVTVSTACGLGAVIHEIGHAVGLYHEQSRRDRDGFVEIFLDRVVEGREHNFSQYTWADGRDVGPYNYGSLMHYGCGFFRRDGAGNTLEPIMPDTTCGDLGGTGLSEGDILGVYTLYPPAFSITGAVPFETRDRFELGLAFTSSPARADHIEWTSDRVPDVLATGRTLSTVAADLPPGDHVITASIVVRGTTVGSASVPLKIFNNPPVVDLGPDREVDLNRLFYVTASVTDVEDGSCPVGVCTYTWDPPPMQDMGGTAAYRYAAVGPRPIFVRVRDGGGATGRDSIIVTLVTSPPEPFIDSPLDGSTFSSGSTLEVSGYATHVNMGADPPPGLMPCEALEWSSSDPTDVFGMPLGCSGPLTFGAPGVRTISLTATDLWGGSASTSVTVSVAECGASCPPDVSFVLDTPSELDGSIYDPPFTGPGYYLSTPIQATGTINDADDPPDNPVGFEWRLTRPCFAPGGSCPDDLVLSSGVLFVPDGPAAAQTSITWTPEVDIPEWLGCVTTALPYTLRLWASDSRGETNIASRTIHLACVLR